MRVPHGAPKSSFGIPQEAREQAEQLRQQKESAEKLNKVVPEAAPEKQTEEDWPIQEQVEQKKEDIPNPMDHLKKLGIEPTEDDYVNLLFRGEVEKVVPIGAVPGGRQLTAKIKTLTTEEVEWVDEMVAKEIEKTPMTGTGLEFRRSGWTMAFAVLELSGRPVSKPVLVDGVFDAKKTAEERRKVISKLSPYIVDKIIRIHAEMTAAFNLIITEPTGEFVKKS